MVSPVTALTVGDIMVTAQKLLWPTVRGAAPGTLEIWKKGSVSAATSSPVSVP